MARLLNAAVLMVVLTAPLQAQTPSVRAGDYVRVQSSVLTGEFLVIGIAADTIIMGDSMNMRVPYSSITKLQVKLPPSQGRDVALGAAQGALAGAAMAIALGLMFGEHDGFFGTTGEIIGEALPLCVAGGAATGVIGAITFPRERWSEVPLEGRPQIGIAPRGAIRIGYVLPLPRL